MKRTILFTAIALLLLNAVFAFSTPVSLKFGDVVGFSADPLRVDLSGGNSDISGKLFLANGNAAPENTPVSVYCYDNGVSHLVKELSTKADGTFEAKTINVIPDTRCDKTDVVYVKSGEFTSEMLEMSRGSGSSSRSSSTNDNLPGVPEFNTITFALAIVVAGLGLVFVRRQ